MHPAVALVAGMLAQKASQTVVIHQEPDGRKMLEWPVVGVKIDQPIYSETDSTGRTMVQLFGRSGPKFDWPPRLG